MPVTTQDRKQRGHVAYHLMERGHDRAALDYLNCGHPQLIRHWRVCSESIHHHASPVGFSCHLRICQDCARRQSARLLNRYLPVARKAFESNHPEYMLRHLVLTTNWSLHDPDINARIRQAWKAFNKLLLIFWGEDWQNSGRGWLGGYEFGEDGQKLHLHIMVYCEWMWQCDLSYVWYLLTGNKVVWINQVRGVKKGVKEVLKYAVKLTELPPRDLALLHDVIARTRRVRAGGIFYNVPEPEKLEKQLCKRCHADIIDMQCEVFHKILMEEADRLPRASALLHLIIGNKSSQPPPVRDTSTLKPIIANQIGLPGFEFYQYET